MSIPWNVLVVDDDKEICDQVQKFLRGESINGNGFYVESVQQFSTALDHVRKYKVDVIILDIRSDEEVDGTGLGVLEALKRECFVPVIFYTGLPKEADNVKNEVVKVVDKTHGLYALLDAVREIMDTGIPFVHRVLTEHMHKIERDYMWTFLVETWNKYSAIPNRTELAYLLAKRLSRSFDNYGIERLAEILPKPEHIDGDALYDKVSSTYVSPMQYYIVPPIEEHPLTGDLYYGNLGFGDRYWMVLTPSCDFRQGKDENVLLAECHELVEDPEYRKWIDASGAKQQNLEINLRNLMMNRKTDRTYFLPSFLNNPNLVADFSRLRTALRGDFYTLIRIASLDSSFVAEAVSHFLRHYGRHGTPDLNTDIVMNKLVTQIAAPERGVV